LSFHNRGQKEKGQSITISPLRFENLTSALHCFIRRP
jgi:hypothetical protein